MKTVLNNPKLLNFTGSESFRIKFIGMGATYVIHPKSKIMDNEMGSYWEIINTSLDSFTIMIGNRSQKYRFKDFDLV